MKSHKTPRRRRIIAVGVVLSLLFVGLPNIVGELPPAHAAIIPCNPDDADWPECLPTTEQLTAALSTDRDTAVFWTGGTEGQAGIFAADRGGTTLEAGLERANLRMPNVNPNSVDCPYDAPTCAIINEIWIRASLILANQASGIAYVVRGQFPRLLNVWQEQELPRLQEVGRVDCVIAVRAWDGTQLVEWHGPSVTEVECLTRMALNQLPFACNDWDDDDWVRDNARAVHANYGQPVLPTASLAVTPAWQFGNDTAAPIFSIFPTITGDPNVSAIAIQGAFQTPESIRPSSIRIIRTNEAGNLQEILREGLPGEFNCTSPPANPLARNYVMMGLGSSTTYGTGSSHGAGYRRSADIELQKDSEVDWVGSVKVGTMDDREVEGWPGYRINEIAGKASCAVKTYQPNIVTLIAGGNDVQQNYDMPGAIGRLENLIRQITRDAPGVLVLVAGVQPLRDPAADARGEVYSNQVRDLAKTLSTSGVQVIYTDVSTLDQSHVGPDGIHPTDAGYDIIGRAFAASAQTAIDQGRALVTNPPRPDAASHPCGLTDGGNGDGATPVIDRRWEDHGVSFKDGFGQGNSYRWGDVNGDKLPEFFVVKPDQSWTFYWNSGRTPTGWTGWAPGVFRAASATGLVGNELRFTDFDTDGHVDCIRVNLKGQIHISIWDDSKAVGQKLCGKVWLPSKYSGGTSDVFPLPRDIPSTTRIDIVDLDGNGLADYVLTDRFGASEAWLWGDNPGHPGTFLWKQGQIVRPAGDAARERRWADINGDGMADQILITAAGGARAWINGGFSGSEPRLPGTFTFRDIGEIATDKNVPPKDVQFADADGNGRADFIRTGWTGVTHIWTSRLTANDLTP